MVVSLHRECPLGGPYNEDFRVLGLSCIKTRREASCKMKDHLLFIKWGFLCTYGGEIAAKQTR